jgi:hypothetical protein
MTLVVIITLLISEWPGKWIVFKLPHITGAVPGFQVRGAHLKKLGRAEGGAKIFGVFRAKNHDFTPKNHIVSNCGGRCENFWGISCEKSRYCAKKSYFYQFIIAKRNRASVIQECNIPYVQEKPGFLNDTGGGATACCNQIHSRYHKYTRMKSGGRTICAVRCNMS